MLRTDQSHMVRTQRLFSKSNDEINANQCIIYSSVQIFNITGASTDNAGYVTLAVTHIAGAGSFADTDTLSVEFSRTGNKGADGAGSGDVIGPGSAVDSQLAAFDTTTGKLIKDAGAGATAAAIASQGGHLY